MPNHHKTIFKKKALTVQYSAIPTTNCGMQSGSSVGTRTRCMHVFARLAPISYAELVPINKNLCIGARPEACAVVVVGWVVSYTFVHAVHIMAALKQS